jgi:hypothetical protein
MSAARYIASGALFLLAWLPAQAQQRDNGNENDQVNVQIGSALVCDTQQQVERFVALYDGNMEAALKAVNAGQKKRHACDIATIAYVMGPEVSTASSSGGTFRVVRVLVLGVLTEKGLKASVPKPFYSVARVEEIEA